ncbi:MAG: tRNA pseudouridine(38-40) synthase TruA [Alphaproteobacteria bacterium]
MPRYKLILAYDGGPFMGWQRQDHGPSVQAALEAALERYCGAPVPVQAAGRTDSGVHALGQVVHADIPRPDPPLKVQDALNALLRPHPVAVLVAERVAADFSARFDATGRSYRYRILNRRAPPALERGRVWHLARPLDVAAMGEAARLLVGHHDFTSFRALHCQSRSPVKTLDHLEVVRAGEEVHVDAVARSFLHHQVRNIVGTLVQVGLGRWEPADVSAALAARDRAAAGPTAPPEGLYLMSVDYQVREIEPETP